MRAPACIAIVAFVLGVAAGARAQEPTPEVRTEAAEHFDRGILFFTEQRFDAALAEFTRAYALMPAHQTLYNLARVHAALGHAVEATAAYERYLREAPADLGARRRREAEEALEEQQARIGRLLVRSDVLGATVSVGGVDVATTPLAEALSLAAGSHTIELRAPGRETVRVGVTLAGREERVLEVSLRASVEPRGTLRVEASLPEVTIAIGDHVVGSTPLPSTVPLRAGEHRVVARRPGYREEIRSVLIEDGAEAEVRFDLRRDPAPATGTTGRLHLRLPDAPYLVRVDGETMLGVDLELPIGAHRIELEVTDRRPYEGTARIEPSRTVEVVPPLSWTLEARRQRLQSAESQRTAGTVTTIGGAVVLAAGLATLVWNESEIARSDSRLVQINDELPACWGTGMDSRCEMLEREGRGLEDRQPTQDVLRGVSIAAAIVGVGATSIGLALWLGAPNEDEIDAAARARARLRIADGVWIDGVF